MTQAVISASALSLLYPDEGIEGDSLDAFLDDLVDEVEKDIRRCLEAGAHAVQIDFTESRLAVKIDPSTARRTAFAKIEARVEGTRRAREALGLDA